MSRAASGLLRPLLARAGEEQHRILLIDVESTDWQSLTLSGERHAMTLRITGEDAMLTARQLTDGLEDAEFRIVGHILADIAAVPTFTHEDGSISVAIEALTISE